MVHKYWVLGPSEIMTTTLLHGKLQQAWRWYIFSW